MQVLALLLTLLGGGPPDSTAAVGGVISRLDVSGYPLLRAWVRWPGPETGPLLRIRAEDLRVETGAGLGVVTGLIPPVESGRTFILVILGAHDPAAIRRFLIGIGGQLARRAVAGDRLIVVRAGPAQAVHDGPGDPLATIQSSLAAIPETTSVRSAQVLAAARGLAPAARPGTGILLVAPSGSAWTGRNLTTLLGAFTSAGITPVLAGGGTAAVRAAAAARLGAIDGSDDPAAGARRWLMTGAQSDSSGGRGVYQVVAEVRGAVEGQQDTLRVSLGTTVAGLEAADLSARLTFVAQAPGRVAVGAGTPRRPPDPRLLATAAFSGLSAVLVLALAVLRRRRG